LEIPGGFVIRYLRFETSIGPVLATACAGFLTGVYYEGGRHAPQPRPGWVEDANDPTLAECARQLREYLEGRRRAFELPVRFEGTPFQERIWQAIARIPYGETVTYASLARAAGAPGCARAAGAATGRNPLSIVVPCHRVVGTSGALTGYAGGLERKSRLLGLERAVPVAA
jgi:methylated-DNA-[protein]-cysteine S-methyltransferase